MAIQRYRPYSLLDNLQREMSTLFQSPAAETNLSEEHWAPAVDFQLPGQSGLPSKSIESHHFP